jgi:hypothetical protein
LLVQSAPLTAGNCCDGGVKSGVVRIDSPSGVAWSSPTAARFNSTDHKLNSTNHKVIE